MFRVCIKKILNIKMVASALLTLFLLTIGFMVHTDTSTVQPVNLQTPATQGPPILEEGKQYRRVPVTVSQNPKVLEFIAQDPGKIQVIEFFSYGCFGCQQLHAMINQWVKEKESAHSMPIVLYRIPLVFHPAWESLAKIYYAVKILGLNEKLDADFFTAVNQHHVDFSKDSSIEDFVKVREVDPALFMETYRSFGVNRQLVYNNEIGVAYQVTVSPFFVVNTPAGSFMTSAVMAGGPEGLLNVLNHLISLQPP